MRTTRSKRKIEAAEALEIVNALPREARRKLNRAAGSPEPRTLGGHRVSDFPTDRPDERYTPPTIIRELHRIYRFTIDAFSHPSTPAAQIIGDFWTERDDALTRSWHGQRVFAQPPYSRLAECIEKGFTETSSTCPLVVFLVPAWTDREWWATFVERFRDRPFSPFGRTPPGDDAPEERPRKISTRFLPGRMTFGNPAQPDIEAEIARRKAAGLEAPTQAQFGMVLIEFWGRTE